MVTLLTAFGPQHSQLESAVCAAVSKPIASHPPERHKAEFQASQLCVFVRAGADAHVS